MNKYPIIFIIILFLPFTVLPEGFGYSNDLKQKLANALAEMPKDYQPRTQYICKNTQPCYTNRLILENSPYLLQHAHNPVDWHVWGEEAFKKAKRENKPIFLSVGYAACHWCHVMERESFDNTQIAEFLNKHFISIKVDRERRPDIDEFYGNAMLYFIGQQGWPMSLFLTPDAKPFDGGGYYTSKQFKSLLIENSEYWNKSKKEVNEDADKVMRIIKTHLGSVNQLKTLDPLIRRRAIKDLLGLIDNYYGGFGESIKFPREPWLSLLLNDSYGKKENNDSLVAITNTLTHIARGGINDQLAGGFHRYATDPYWQVPHFEKMLYNQSLLLSLYLKANTIKPNSYYLKIAKNTADFMLSEMQDPKGGFYSALDADTEGKEGSYYLWQIEEWQELLNTEDGLLFSELFDVDDYGEAVDGSNVLYLTSSFSEFAEEKNISLESLVSRFENIRIKLLDARNKRIKPTIDDKIIMGWNGLAITALAESSLHINKPMYLQEAIRASEFIWNNMQTKNEFYRIHYKGENTQPAQLYDYAFYLQSLIALYDIDKNKMWLNRATILTNIMLKKFWDNKLGGFYNTVEHSDAPLPFRPKSAFDKTLPSGNSVAAHMLIKLFRRTGNDRYETKANETIAAFASHIEEIPSAFSGLLIASNELVNGEFDLPIYAVRGHLRIDAFIKAVNTKNYKLMIDLKFDDNWHINSNKPFESYLIPTSINLLDNTQWQLKTVDYPNHDVIDLDFSQKPMALYQNHILIKSQLKKGNTNLNPVIKLRIQACNDKLCLPPENIVIYPRLLITNQ